jgi:DNA-binding transcriptional regulator YdaS (Cro superfamily)
MTIGDYLKKYKKTHQWLADKVSVRRTAVGNWVNGTRQPRPDTANLIVTATNGRVTLKDIYV